MRQVGTKVPMVDESNLPEDRVLAFSGVRYVLGHQIARGGFSTVYKARDDWGNRLVAKVYAAETKPAMWQNDAKRLARLRHPQIVYMHACGEIGGKGHLIIEDGGIGIGRVNVGDARERRIVLRLAAKGICEALHFIHSKGLVHTDINPGNALLQLTPDNKPVTVKLCDMGLCIEADQLVRGRHTAKWNPPPENLDERFGELGPAMDVYSAALVLLELLLGEELIRFTEEEIMQGLPQQRALETAGDLGKALSSALSPQASERPTPLELWKRVAQVKENL